MCDEGAAPLGSLAIPHQGRDVPALQQEHEDNSLLYINLVENGVRIPTLSGEIDAFFVRPKASTNPAVLLWPDIAGLRPASQHMARELAAHGYTVLAINPYYRDALAPVWESFSDWRTNDGFARAKQMRQRLSAKAIASDGRAIVDWLDQQECVDSQSKMGIQGYCLGGPPAVQIAAERSDRIGAVAVFHGKLLMQGQPKLSQFFRGISAELLFAIARDDAAANPTEKRDLKQAAIDASLKAEIEIYNGNHGWTVSDVPTYEPFEASRAFERLLALYRRTL